MKSHLLRALLVAVVVSGFGLSVLAEGDADAATPKKEGHGGKEIRGVLSAKGADAAENVLAVLTSKSKDGEKKYNLTSSDKEVVEKIKTLVEKNATVAVKGTVTENTIDVTKIAEHKPRAKHGEGAEKHADAPAGGAAENPAK